jgi:hypothetical protein
MEVFLVTSVCVSRALGALVAQLEFGKFLGIEVQVKFGTYVMLVILIILGIWSRHPSLSVDHESSWWWCDCEMSEQHQQHQQYHTCQTCSSYALTLPSTCHDCHCHSDRADISTDQYYQVEIDDADADAGTQSLLML